MNIRKKRKILLIIVFCAVLVGLCIQSTVWFRLELASFYEEGNNFLKAINVYNKILIKNKITEELKNSTRNMINLRIGELYAKLDFSSLALAYYKEITKKPLKDNNSDINYIGDNFEKDKLMAIAYLEAGNIDAAKLEFKKLKDIYSNYKGINKYIEAIKILEDRDVDLADDNFHFTLGDIYIQTYLFNEARSFFTKRILSYIEPIIVLDYLDRRYNKKEHKDIVSKIWGKKIYVVLEDFENTTTRLFRRSNNIPTLIVNEHCINSDVSYRGRRSELLDVKYKKRGYDYWGKFLNLNLSGLDLSVGLRIYVKRKFPSEGYLKVDVMYPKSEQSAHWKVQIKKKDSSDWTAIKIENIIQKAKLKARENNWDTEGMQINLVAIDTYGVSNQYYFDQIELYLEDKTT